MTKLAQRYGWRGLWLMVIGTMWILFGAGVLFIPDQPETFLVHQQIPVEIRAGTWALTGGWAFWTGLRGPDTDDHLGHGALYVMPALRLFSYLASWLTFVGTSALHHYYPAVRITGLEIGWYAALIWALFCVMLAVGARWPNPDPGLLPMPPECDHEDEQ